MTKIINFVVLTLGILLCSEFVNCQAEGFTLENVISFFLGIFGLNNNMQPTNPTVPIATAPITIVPTTTTRSNNPVTTANIANNRPQTYRLFYFDARARGESIRWIFAASNQTFEDFRIKSNEWPAYQANFPFRQLPVLEICENNFQVAFLAQSGAIARYLANRFGLVSSNPVDAAYAAMYYDQLTDLFNRFGAASLEAVTTRRNESLNTVLNEVFPQNLNWFESRLVTNRGFLSGTAISYADLFLSSILDSLDMRKATVLRNYPNVANLDNRVRQIPGIRQWLQRRPVTDL